MPKRVTHSDIAKSLGCDKSTVSLALRNSPRISEETRKRVAAEAARLGYRPDPAISLLARQRWIGHHSGQGATIAYLVESKSGQHSIQRRHIEPAKAAAESRGYRLDVFDLSDYPSGKAASRVLHNRGVRGLVIPAMEQHEWDFMETFAWDKFTVVNCSLGWMRAPFHTVRPDVFEGARLAWDQVAARGYRRIGAALNRHDPVAVDDSARLGASLVAQGELGDGHERVPFLLSDPLDKDAFLQWFEEHRPDAVIGFISAALEWLEEAGYRVPDDVAFASLNVFPTARQISGVSVQTEEVGRAAVDFLIAQMHENRWGIPESQIVYLLEPKWVEGETLPEK